MELAQRVAAYGGVMAARIESVQEQSAPPSAAPAAPMPNRGSSEQVELAAFRMQFPGVVNMTRAAE